MSLMRWPSALLSLMTFSEIQRVCSAFDAVELLLNALSISTRNHGGGVLALALSEVVLAQTVPLAASCLFLSPFNVESTFLGGTVFLKL